MSDGLVRHVFEPPAGSGVLPGLRYVDSGAAGAPVFLQHGLCGSAGQTSELFPAGSAARFLTLECRGHGESPVGDFDDLSIARFTDDLAAFITATTSAPAIAGGVSMGAAITVRLAVKRPDLVRGLILIRPAWIHEAAPPNTSPNVEVARLLARLPAAQAKAEFLAGETARRLEREAPDNLASLAGFFTREPVEATAELLRRISLDGPGVTAEDLRRLQIPALVLGHTDDAIHPIETARELAALLPNARFVEVTPKSVDRVAYVHEIRTAIDQFILELPS